MIKMTERVIYYSDRNIDDDHLKGRLGSDKSSIR